jgi:hypothetical protein
MVALRKILAAPFVLRAETIVAPDGSWTRVVSYPEIGCRVEGSDLMAALEEIEVQRVRALVSAVELGASMSPLREALPDVGVADLLRSAGLAEWVDRLDEQFAWNADPSPLT